MQTVLEQKLVGVYLYGSLVWGDFDQESSDIDLLVATACDIDDQEFSNLHRMQLDFVATGSSIFNRAQWWGCGGGEAAPAPPPLGRSGGAEGPPDLPNRTVIYSK